MSGRADQPSAPEHLTDQHDFSDFASGTPSLDEWLRRRARANEETGASRTYVVCAGGRVVGYYALATGGVALPGLVDPRRSAAARKANSILRMSPMLRPQSGPVNVRRSRCRP